MKVFRRSLLVLSMISPLALAGCGEGWDMQPYKDMEPYTMERTAGSGIEYVRANMAREKAVVLKPEAEVHVPVTKTESIEQDQPVVAVPEEQKDEAVVQEADHIFTSKQKNSAKICRECKTAHVIVRRFYRRFYHLLTLFHLS